MQMAEQNSIQGCLDYDGYVIIRCYNANDRKNYTMQGEFNLDNISAEVKDEIMPLSESMVLPKREICLSDRQKKLK